MEIISPASHGTDPPNPPREENPIYGYTRLRFFEIRFWEFFALVVLVLIVAFSLFPRHQVLVSFYLDRGMVKEALTVVSDMVDQYPEDTTLLVLLSEIQLRNEDPDGAIDSLRRATEKSFDNTVALSKLIKLYEWTRNPVQARRTLEQLVAVDSENFSALNRLREYYYYEGQTDKELAVIERLIHLEKRLPSSAVFNTASNYNDLLQLIRDPLIRAITYALRKIQLRQAGEEKDPFTDELLRGLYAIRANYVLNIQENGGVDFQKRDEIVLRALETYVRMGKYQDAKDFAANLDNLWTRGAKARLLLVQTLRWYRLDDQAIALLTELSREYPDKTTFLVQMAEIALGHRDVYSAITAYIEIVVLRPNEPRYHRVLADLYLEVGDQIKAYIQLKQLVGNVQDGEASALKMIKIAALTGRPDLLHEAALIGKRHRPLEPAVQLAAAKALVSIGEERAAVSAYESYLTLNPDDQLAKEQLAELYVWTQQPINAFQIYRQIAMASNGRLEDVERMQTVAGYTGLPDIIRQALEMALRLRPDDANLHLKMAELRLGVGEEAGAITAYLNYLNLKPDDKSALEQLGKLYLWTGQQEKSFGIYKKLVLLTGSERYLDQLTRIAGYTGRAEIIREALSVRKSLQRLDSSTQLRIAEILLSAGDEKAAIDEYHGYLIKNPDDLDARQSLAELYIWNNQARDAYQQYKEILTAGGVSAERVDRLIEVAGYTGDPALITEALQVSRRLLPNDPGIRLKVAGAFLAMGIQAAAISAYNEYLDLKPNDEKVLQKLFELYVWTKQPRKALFILEHLYPEMPKSFEKSVAAADAYIEAGDVRKGIEFLEHATTFRPDELGLRRRLLTYYGWIEAYEKSRETLEYLFERQLASEEEKLMLAQFYLDSKKAEKALAVLYLYKNQTPLDLKGGMALLSAYEQSGRVDAAERILRRLGRDHSKKPGLLVDLGNRALWLNRNTVAQDLYLAALRIDPKNLKALKGSGQVYAWNNNPERAIRKFEAYNRLNPNDYEVRYQLGELYFFQKRTGDAFRQYRQALSLIDRAEQRSDAKPVPR